MKDSIQEEVVEQVVHLINNREMLGLASSTVMTARHEFADCISVYLGDDPKTIIWFGTADHCWAGDIYETSYDLGHGMIAGSVDTKEPSESKDSQAIASRLILATELVYTTLAAEQAGVTVTIYPQTTHRAVKDRQ